jgi:hypothetical protein
LIIISYLAQGVLHITLATPAVISQSIVANEPGYKFDPFRSNFGIAVGLITPGNPNTMIAVDQDLIDISL